MPITYLDEKPKNSSMTLPKRKITYLDDEPTQPYQGVEPQNILEQGFNVPGAAMRSMLQGKGYAEGAANPSKVPKFQDLAIQKAQFTKSPTMNAVLGMPASALGLVADIATNPADVLTSMLPFAPGVKQVGQAVAGSKFGQGVGKVLNADLGKTFNKIKNFPKDAFAKSRPDYLVNEVAPKAHEVFQKKIIKFTPEIQNYAKTKKIPDQAIKDIKTFGTKDIEDVANQYGNSSDGIFQKIEQGFNTKEKLANDFYHNVMANAPDTKSIDIKPSIDKAGGVLKKIGLINKNGNLTEMGKSEIAKDSVYGKLLDFYKSADSLSGVKYIKSKGAAGDLTINQGSKLLSSRFNTNVNKEQYTFLRDKLNSLWKGKSSDIGVGKVVNQFYQDGELSGITGLQEARKKSKMVFNMKERFENSQGDLKSLLQEKSLDKFYNLSQKSIRRIKEAEKYIETPIMDDLKKLSSSKYLNKIMEGKNKENFITLIDKASDPKYTVSVRNQLKDLIGQKEADKIIKEVVAHRRLRGGIKASKWVGGAVGLGSVVKGGEHAINQF